MFFLDKGMSDFFLMCLMYFCFLWEGVLEENPRDANLIIGEIFLCLFLATQKNVVLSFW